MRQESLRKEVIPLIPALLLGIALFPLYSSGGEPSLKGHWRRPALAGKGDFSLYPRDCGSCHAAQYEGWKGSLHAKAVGPGLLGQLDAGENPETALSCYTCHAPLMEQQEKILEKTGGKYLPNSRFDPSLKKSGVTCAVCHARGGKVFGPPPAGELKTAGGKGKKHGRSETRDFFRKSEFCAACHQLDNGYELNGKPLVNTFREWEKSEWAKNGAACQDCHMPNREHLFRGIHDKDMTLNAVDFSVSWSGDAVKLLISNTGAGHYFPTYVTPLIALKAFSLDASGKTIAGSQREDFIGRKVSLDLEKEEFDTRIPPGGAHEFTYDDHEGSSGVVFEVWVYPDNFYNESFKSLLAGDGAPNPALIGEALGKTASSPYLLWKSGALAKSMNRR